MLVPAVQGFHGRLERLRSLLPAGLAMGLTVQLLANLPLAGRIDVLRR